MKIIQGVNMLNCTEKSHVYLIQGEENILIDTGFPGQSTKILDEIKSIGVDPTTIRHILLTHHDVDQIGNARVLQNVAGATLWASKDDVPYIIRKRNKSGIKGIIQTLILYRKPIINNIYEENESVGGVQVIKTPGHTPGHVIFLYNNILFAGDLFKITNGKIKLMPKRKNWNEYHLEKSLSLLKGLDCEWICPSHGSPIRRNYEWEKFIEKY